MQNVRVLVEKRDGRTVDYDEEKIFQAMLNAFSAQGYMKEASRTVAEIMDEINDLTSSISEHLLDNEYTRVSVEALQDLVIDRLFESEYVDVAREYLRHSSKRTALREEYEDILKSVEKVSNNDASVVNENANKDSRTLATKRDLISGQVAKSRGIKMLPKVVANAHLKGDLHFHDLDFSPFLPYSNCCLVDLENMLSNGFNMGETFIDTPNHFDTAINQASQIVASVATSQYGGTTLHNVDLILEPYAEKNYQQHLVTGNRHNIPDVENYALELTIKDIKDGMESLEYNINSLHGNGGQTPQWGLNYVNS